jgi:hypothetical protein
VIGAVVFDVGECLVDETREYGTWADWLGVPRHVFSAVFGPVIAHGQDYRHTFQVFQPGFDLDKARQQRADEGKLEWFCEDDLYPDVRPTLARLRYEGLWVGIAGTRPPAQAARGVPAGAELFEGLLGVAAGGVGVVLGGGAAGRDTNGQDRGGPAGRGAGARRGQPAHGAAHLPGPARRPAGGAGRGHAGHPRRHPNGPSA